MRLCTIMLDINRDQMALTAHIQVTMVASFHQGHRLPILPIRINIKVGSTLKPATVVLIINGVDMATINANESLWQVHGFFKTLFQWYIILVTVSLFGFETLNFQGHN